MRTRTSTIVRTSLCWIFQVRILWGWWVISHVGQNECCRRQKMTSSSPARILKIQRRAIRFREDCERLDLCRSSTSCRETSQSLYGSSIIVFVCKSETIGEIGEMDEMGERELVLVVSVGGKGLDVTRRWQLFQGHQGVFFALCSSWATRVRVMKCDNVVQIC